MAILVDLIVGAITYNLNDEIDFKLVGEDGMGLPPSHLITNRSPLQDGAVVQDFRLDPRIVWLVVWGMGQSETLHYEQRDTLLKALKLSTTGVKLRYTLTDGTIRQIDGFYDHGLSFGTQYRERWLQRNGFGLYFPDPLFYDPAGEAISFQTGAGGDTFPVPMSVPHKVGTSTMDSTKPITNDGTWKSFPFLIRITGPITNPIVTNTTIDKKLDFTGITIAAANYYDIDLRFGYKTIVNQADVNKIADLTNDSDLVDWHLGVEPDVPDGINSVHVEGTNITGATKFEISYYEKYIGF